VTRAEGNRFCDGRDSYEEYNEKVEKLAKQLMNVIIEGLEVNAAHFQRYVDKAFGLLRWNHYPPCPQPHKTLGMSAHTDFNLLTVLHQGDIGGLQVQKDGNWVL
jgi:isopenicillin N synthase-like dioxygenase